MVGRTLRFGARHCAKLWEWMFYGTLNVLPYFRFIRETRGNVEPIPFEIWFAQKVGGTNRKAYWPMHRTSTFSGNVGSIALGVGSHPGLAPGCYVQAIGQVQIGSYTMFGPNVGLISANHSIRDLREWKPGKLEIGSYCWIGMNAVILPGVVLGDFTIVGAGSVVTQPFPEGYCVLRGNPAQPVRSYRDPAEQQQFVRYKDPHEYVGYIPAERFPEFRKKHLWL